jgi:hypothetical protein
MASGDRTESRLGGPIQLGTTTTTICTAAAGRTEVIKQIIICNTDTADRTVTLAIGSAAMTLWSLIQPWCSLQQKRFKGSLTLQTL